MGDHPDFLDLIEIPPMLSEAMEQVPLPKFHDDDRHRTLLLRAGIAAVQGPQHVVIVTGTIETAWALRDATIHLMEQAGYDPTAIRRLHGWAAGRYHFIQRMRTLNEDEIAADLLAVPSNERSSRRAAGRRARSERFEWVESAVVLNLGRPKPPRRRRPSAGMDARP